MLLLSGLPDPNRVGFLADGRVVTSGELRTVQILDPGGAPPVDFVGRHYDHLGAFGLSADGKWVYVHRPDEPGMVAVDPASGKAHKFFKTESVHTRALAADPHGPRVLQYGFERIPFEDRLRRQRVERTCNVFVCHRHAGRGGPKEVWRRERKQNEPEPVLLAFLPGDRFVSLEVTRKGNTAGWVHHLAVREAPTAGLVATVKCPTAVEEIATAPDGSVIVTRVGTQLTVWPLDTFPKKPRVIEGNARDRLAAVATAFHPTAPLFAVAGNDATVTFHDTITWTVAKKYRWPVKKIRSVAFSPDGTLAAAGSESGQVVVWDVDG